MQHTGFSGAIRTSDQYSVLWIYLQGNTIQNGLLPIRYRVRDSIELYFKILLVHKFKVLLLGFYLHIYHPSQFFKSGQHIIKGLETNDQLFNGANYQQDNNFRSYELANIHFLVEYQKSANDQ